jgi:hypothetical protein
MGGRGSGRRANIKLTVEESLFIDINLIRRQGIFDSGRIPVFLKISAAPWEKQVAFINFTFENNNGSSPFLILKYLVKQEDSKQEIEEPVALQSTKLHSGGLRWWFTCPLVLNCRPCLRRVGKLYLPPGGRYFGCRHCYDLTYRSCQQSHKRDWMFDWLLLKVPRDTPRMVKIYLDSIWEQSVQDGLLRWGVEESHKPS